MLNLTHEMKITPAVAREANLTSRFDDDDLRAIGEWVWDGYNRDEASRNDWMRRMEAAMDLALQVQKIKTFPWANCSNIAFPLVTIAAMQFHARAYPALVSGPSIVKCRVPGPDPSGELTLRADRVAQYMSYQVLEEDQPWEEQHDRLLLQLPIVGCAFVKSQFSNGKGHSTTDCVPAKDLCIDYYAKSVEGASRKTQIIPFYRNEVHEKCLSGVWKNITQEPWYLSPTLPYTPPGRQTSDNRKGINPPTIDESAPLVFLEQHCWMDFDKDGYQEPYIVTIEANSKRVVRIVARWGVDEDVTRNGRGQIVRIRAEEFYTKYELIPSPDGSIYGMGFGILLGPLNESVNSLVNMLLDVGTMASASGGFLSRGVKIRGGVYSFSPFQWNRVDSSGDDLNKGIVQLPVREPSDVLYKLLTFLVDYTQRVGGSTDATQGQNPGQNTPASTQQSMIEQGQKIYSGLFKRVWRSMKQEFTKLYILNAKYLPVTKQFGTSKIAREDFMGDPSQVVPFADPNVTSDQMRLQQANAVAQRAHMVPGYDTIAAEKMLLQAMKIDGIDQLFPGPDKVPPLPNPKMMVVQAQWEARLKIAQGQLQQKQQEFVISMQEEQRLNAAKIIELLAHAQQLAAQADGEAKGKQIALIDSMIGMAKARDESLRGHIELLLKGLEQMNGQADAGATGAGQGTGGVEAPPNDQAGAGMA